MTCKLSRYEMETSILWNEEEKTCTCFTCSPALQRRLDGLCAKSLLIHKEEMGDGGIRYTFPKKWVRIVMPCALTEEEKEKRALRIKEAREQRRIAKKEEPANEN